MMQTKKKQNFNCHFFFHCVLLYDILILRSLLLRIIIVIFYNFRIYQIHFKICRTDMLILRNIEYLYTVSLLNNFQKF